jgi:hypothetical protein
MSVRDTILQAVRALCKAIAADTALTDYQVIPADEDGTRPDLPYLTVRVGAVVGVGSGDVMDKWTAGTSLTRTHEGFRRASVSIQGYGAGSEEWLESIRLRLGEYAVSGLETTWKVSFCDVGETLDLSAMLDTAIEPRFSLDLFVHLDVSSTESVPVAASVILTTSGDLATTKTLSV